MHGNYPVMPNHTLAKVVHDNMLGLGGIRYDDAERAFAEKFKQASKYRVCPLGSERCAALCISPGHGVYRCGRRQLAGSDGWVHDGYMGPRTSAHSWQAAAGGMSIGLGHAFSDQTAGPDCSGFDWRPTLIAAATEELKRSQGPDFKHAALLGDRLPPLDYRRWACARCSHPRRNGRQCCRQFASQAATKWRIAVPDAVSIAAPVQWGCGNSRNLMIWWHGQKYSSAYAPSGQCITAGPSGAGLCIRRFIC